jgi:hypothetical protein
MPRERQFLGPGLQPATVGGAMAAAFAIRPGRGCLAYSSCEYVKKHCPYWLLFSRRLRLSSKTHMSGIESLVKAHIDELLRQLRNGALVQPSLRWCVREKEKADGMRNARLGLTHAP